MDATNRVVAGWILEERLGSGGFGEVWKARRRHVDLFRALKLVPVSNETAFASWRHEISRLEELSHPNIVRFYDADIVNDNGPYDDFAWIATELCERSLAAELRRRDPPLLTTSECAPLVEEMLAALAAAHGSGCVHRDVKPANVLWHRSGVWKLCDFGTARLITPGESHPRTAVIGTFPYMSPAAHRGQQDQAADLYALGVTVHEALCGRRLHPRSSGMTDSEYVKLILDTPPTISTRLEPAWHDLIAALIGTDGPRRADDLLGQVRRTRANLARPTGDEPTLHETGPTEAVPPTPSPSPPVRAATPPGGATAAYPTRHQPKPAARPSPASSARSDQANLVWILVLVVSSLAVSGLLLNQLIGNALLVIGIVVAVGVVLLLIMALD
jgi:serine/threonine protein kinase